MKIVELVKETAISFCTLLRDSCFMSYAEEKLQLYDTYSYLYRALAVSTESGAVTRVPLCYEQWIKNVVWFVSAVRGAGNGRLQGRSCACASLNFLKMS